MAVETQAKRGWTLAEAVERCADPDLKAEHATAVHDWQAIGAPRRFAYRNRSFWETGDDDNTQTRLGHAKYRRVNATHATILDRLREQLEREGLLAWGRRESALEELRPIPPSAWRVLAMRDLRRSIAQEKTNAKLQILDVRVYPILEAPDAIDHLVGMTLVEACRRCVFDDPEVVARRRRAIAAGGSPATFGDYWEPYRAVWRADVGQRLLQDDVVGLLNDDSSSADASIKAREADDLLQARFARLIGYLSEGLLEADGVPRSGGGAVPIPRSIWQRRHTYIDLENGDLLELRIHSRDHTKALSPPIYKALLFRKPAAPLVADGSASVLRRSKAALSAHDREETHAACLAWLTSEMLKSPQARVKPKEAWRNDAREKWKGTLSDRAFDTAWAEAIRRSGASKWSHAGASPKSARK